MAGPWNGVPVTSDVAALLRAGSSQKWEDGRTSQLRLLPVGLLAVVSGLVKFRDPFAHLPAAVTSVNVPAGNLAVELAMLRFSQSSDGIPEMDLATGVVLRVRAGEPVSWRRAHPAGFAVDAGTGLLCDPVNDDGDASSRTDGLISEVMAHQFVAEPAQGEIHRLFFNCGMGDGDYDVWEGLSAEGSVACIVADLELLSHGDPVD